MRHSKPVRLETAPTGGERVYLFLDFTIKQIHLVSIGNADLRSLRNLFENCPFDAPVIVRVMVPVDDQYPTIVKLH